MYDANRSYDENYQNGPNHNFVKDHRFPQVKFKSFPQFNFLGIPLHIPFGVPAGPLLNAAFVQTALDAGFCLPTYKTVRSQSWPCHPWPNVLKINVEANEQIYSTGPIPTVCAKQFSATDYKQSEISISNSFGVPSKTPQIWEEDFQKLAHNKSEVGKHVALSFQGSTGKKDLLEDLENISEMALNAVSKSGFSLLEINLSCPNEANEPIYKKLKESVKVLKRVHSHLNGHKNIKLIAKIGALDFESTYAFLSETSPYLNAISAINTVSANILNNKRQIILGSHTKTGGVCGSAILKQGLMMCEQLSESREKCGLKKADFGIIGVGGVSTAQHFKHYLDAGADVIQAATGMMWNLDLAKEIAQLLKVDFEEKK